MKFALTFILIVIFFLMALFALLSVSRYFK